MSYKDAEFPLQQVLELACAAQRMNGDYIKMTEPVHASDGKVVAYKWANKIMMQAVFKPESITTQEKPPLLKTKMEDRELSTDIQQFYKRLMFNVIEGTDEFKTKINAILGSENVKIGDFAWVACLPSVYRRDYAKHYTEKRIKNADNEYIANIGIELLDKDCEILSSRRSKNFDAYNTDAIIDNKMVSWMGKAQLKPGPCVVIKARVKDHSSHWQHGIKVTRLNYVKAAQ